MATMAELGNLFANPGSVDMTQLAPQMALQQGFFNTPGYNLAYGNNYHTDPAQRFFNDPGIQKALQISLNKMTNQFAGQGLGQSGALAKGLADSIFSNYAGYIGGQQNLFKDYQTQLAGLTQLGADQSGAQNQLQANQFLGALLSGNEMTAGNTLAGANLSTGQNRANANLATGSNISSLFANQGVLSAGALMNTAAAQANNMYLGMNLLAQLNANNAASNAQTASSMFRGMGQQQGAQAAQGMSNLFSNNSSNNGPMFPNAAPGSYASMF